MTTLTAQKMDLIEAARRDLAEWAKQVNEAIFVEEDWLKNVTVIIKTFERPCCIVRLLKSIRKYYPCINILVCDDSQLTLFSNCESPQTNITWLTLPFEAGHTLGAGRNYLLDQVQTKYFFLCDDDHIFNENTRLDKLFNFLERSNYDLVAGTQGQANYGTAIFEQRGDVVYQRFFQHRGLIEPKVVKCDRVSNTFMARTEAIRTVYWEPRVMADEHAEFFLRAYRQGLNVAQMGGVYVDHNHDCERATGIGKWLGWILPHRDRGYHNLMFGSYNFLGIRSNHARLLQKKYCFEKNGIRKIVGTENRLDKTRFYKLLEG